MRPKRIESCHKFQRWHAELHSSEKRRRRRPSLTNLPSSLHRSIISWDRHTQNFQLLIFCFKFQVTQKLSLLGKLNAKGSKMELKSYTETILKMFCIFSHPSSSGWFNTSIVSSLPRQDSINISRRQQNFPFFSCLARQNFYSCIGENPTLNPE